MAIGARKPVTGYVVADGADNFVGAVVKLAENRPSILAALQKLSQLDPASDAIRYLLAIGVAARVDAEAIKPDDTLPKLLGIDIAFNAVHDVQPDENTVPMPNGRFSTIS